MERQELETVIYEKDGPIARIILNRPEKANSQSSEMVWDVENCLNDAEQDYNIKVVIMKAEGRGFSAGHDRHTQNLRKQQKPVTRGLDRPSCSPGPYCTFGSSRSQRFRPFRATASVAEPTSRCSMTLLLLQRTLISRCLCRRVLDSQVAKL